MAELIDGRVLRNIVVKGVDCLWDLDIRVRYHAALLLLIRRGIHLATSLVRLLASIHTSTQGQGPVNWSRQGYIWLVNV